MLSMLSTSRPTSSRKCSGVVVKFFCQAVVLLSLLLLSASGFVPPPLRAKRSYVSSSASCRHRSDLGAANGDSSKNDADIDWSRADSSSQIFPGGPALGGLGRQSGYTTSSPYSRALSRKKKGRLSLLDRIRGKEDVDAEIVEDGYDQMYHKRQPIWKRVGKKILRRKEPEPGNLVLVRHGESSWNANKT